MLGSVASGTPYITARVLKILMCIIDYKVEYEDITTSKIKIEIFWDMTPCISMIC